LSLQWNRLGVIDNNSGDDGTDELRQFGWEEWKKESSYTDGLMDKGKMKLNIS